MHLYGQGEKSTFLQSNMLSYSNTHRLKAVLFHPYILLASIFITLYCFYNQSGSMLCFVGVDDSVTTYQDEIPMRELVIAAVDAAERGGIQVKLVKEGKDLKEKSKGKTLEGVDNPVTLGDRLSHKEMYHSLHKRFPYVKIVSEEAGKTDSEVFDDVKPASIKCNPVSKQLPFNLNENIPARDILIWIDPLDATKEYTESLTQYVTTMVCVAVKGVPVIGVIHNPFTKSTTWAWKNVVMSNVDHSKDSNNGLTFIVSRSHSGNAIKSLEGIFGKSGVNVVPAGGAGFKSLAVLHSSADAYMHVTRIKKWDVCSGAAILSSYGGNLTNLKGENIDFGNPEDYVMKDGLLATLRGHNVFVQRLKPILSDLKTH